MTKLLSSILLYWIYMQPHLAEKPPTRACTAAGGMGRGMAPADHPDGRPPGRQKANGKLNRKHALPLIGRQKGKFHRRVPGYGIEPKTGVLCKVETGNRLEPQRISTVIENE